MNAEWKVQCRITSYNVCYTKLLRNGSVNELKEAIRIMSKYQLGNEFTPAQIEDVEAFLKTLEGERVKYLDD